ncbi:MAG TPA: cell division protein FtsA [Ferruginibacter sp.]|nr:cell division protein FtsA [Bacteroidota bacterium]MBS1925252.1 cell division protein FtsA [Bacteroidota bacterium]HMT95102.1 cell division protein FtsA [Ferruginibacter sp.]HMU23916.1 cell division protein FtsA [Ferruginibacter sp.]HRD43278.1 cell division protein FtsA [Ferruginibacter sp.]
MNHEQPIIVGLDIGTTKIAAIAGRKNEFGKLEILGYGRANSSGVQHGMVLNIEQTIKSIQLALENCYKSNPELVIKEVYVGIAGQHIKSLQTRGDIVRQQNEEEICQDEIDRLIADQYRTYIPAGDQIIDVIPQEFTVDNFQNIPNPIGYSGVKVGANFHIITGDKNAIRNINRAVEKSGLKTKDLMLQPLASAAAVMCDQDLEAGVAIVDIGGGTTDLAVFYEGILKHTAVIPFGGENITNDIKSGLGVLKTQAEQMKVQFGSALSDEARANTFITIPGLRGMAAKEISVKNLANIIQARMSEIMDFVSYHLKQIGLDNRMLNGGIILTGGGSQLKHLIQLTEYVTGMNARIGYPNEHLSGEHTEELAKPMYSTCIGLILKGYNDYENKNKSFEKEYSKITVEEEEQQENGAELESVAMDAADEIPVKKRKGLKKFMDSFKNNLIEMFKEEGDAQL